MTRTLRIAAVALLLAPAPALAENYLCSGIGEDDRQEANALPHNLRMVYSTPGGSYLGGIETKVSRGNETVLTAVCEGPWMQTTLPAGTYSVTATHEGKTKTTTVSVPARGRTEKTVAFN